MAKYRPSKSFLWAMGGMLPIGVVLVFGLLPELEAISKPPIPGLLVFPATRPLDVPLKERKAPGTTASPDSGGWSMDWLTERYEDVMAWEHNPWKRRKMGFGDHYFDLYSSKDPADIAKLAELRRRSADLYQRLLKRYPELAVSLRNVPDERNGFLKLLELMERFNADPRRPAPGEISEIPIPGSLKNYLSGSGTFDTAEAKAWLAKEKALLDEVRTIGLMPEQSIAEIDVHRYSFFSARFVKGFSDMLLLEARLAAEEGDAARALEAVQAAKGLAAHLGNVEAPNLLAVTVQILLDMTAQSEAISHVIPALPPGQFDPAAWEAVVVRPKVVPPSEFSRIMKGEWHTGVQEFVLPIVSNVDDPKYPPDPEAFVDYYSSVLAEVVASHDSSTVADWTSVAIPPQPDMSHLSKGSRQVSEVMSVGMQAWAKGMLRAQHVAGMNHAAFAIMKGQPIPNDPIHGLPYVWDPATRQLSAPANPAFDKQQLKPITVPGK